MKPSAWLVELHRQWFAARGKKLTPATRPFSRRWEDLLDEAKLTSAAERSHAEREAANLEAESKLAVKRHRYRPHIIESVAVPVSAEAWLIEICGGASSTNLRNRSLEIVH